MQSRGFHTAGIGGLAIILLLHSVTAPLGAGVPAGRWEKVAALERQTPLLVDLESGAVLVGRFGGLTGDALILERYGQNPLEIERAVIRRVTLDDPGTDPVWNGLLIGAASGASLFAAFSKGDLAISSLAGFAIFSGLGLGIGAAIDASFNPDKVIYRSP